MQLKPRRLQLLLTGLLLALSSAVEPARAVEKSHPACFVHYSFEDKRGVADCCSSPNPVNIHNRFNQCLAEGKCSSNPPQLRLTCFSTVMENCMRDLGCKLPDRN